MEQFFTGWDVDCEYDRDGFVRMYLRQIAQCDQQRETDAIVPDIIVHHRREYGSDHNLLVIELKKDDPNDVCDRMKLELLTDAGGRYRRYAYRLGLYINTAYARLTAT
jgi:hypothetical protein